MCAAFVEYPSMFMTRATSIKVLATRDAAEKWLRKNEPEGVAFEYEVLE
jgi:hypothetical protein